MLNIKGFFARIQGIQAREMSTRAAVSKSVKNRTGIEIPPEDISFVDRSVVLKNISQTARSAIFVKKSMILEDVNKNQSVRKIADIR